jgi:hypothetical protein
MPHRCDKRFEAIKRCLVEAVPSDQTLLDMYGAHLALKKEAVKYAAFQGPPIQVSNP